MQTILATLEAAALLTGAAGLGVLLASVLRALIG